MLTPALCALQLYANYKQGMGEDFSKATPAGTFDFQVSHALCQRCFAAKVSNEADVLVCC